ncbi:helix-turn-helix domain-containing protein [Streptomyces sp. NPDC090082]|uniref:helix-turn-helix domain-containing protein n=1 Tax=unclassified Streptomyces TaxID=2593676 RepID=UPI0038216CDD
MSLTEVAHRAEVTKGFLSRLERGLTSVSVPTSLRVREVLRIGSGELFAYPDEQVVDGGSRIGRLDPVVARLARIRSDARAAAVSPDPAVLS